MMESSRLVANSGRALDRTELIELICVARLGYDKDHRAEPSLRFAQVGQPRDHRDSIAGPDGLEVFPLRAAVESAKRLYVELYVEETSAERAAEGRRRHHPAEPGKARLLLVVEDRVGIADRLGEAANCAALDFDRVRRAFAADHFSCFVGYNVVFHLRSLGCQDA